MLLVAGLRGGAEFLYLVRFWMGCVATYRMETADTGWSVSSMRRDSLICCVRTSHSIHRTVSKTLFPELGIGLELVENYWNDVSIDIVKFSDKGMFDGEKYLKKSLYMF